MTLQSVPVKPSAVLAVIADGKQVGDVKPTDYGKFHAAINLNGDGTGCRLPGVLIQGFGADPDKAIADAIKDGLAYHRGAVVAICEFAAKIAEPTACLSV